MRVVEISGKRISSCTNGHRLGYQERRLFRSRLHRTLEVLGFANNKKTGGREKNRQHQQSRFRIKKEENITYAANATSKAISGVISCMFPSFALEIVIVESIVARTIQTLASATCRPGQILSSKIQIKRKFNQNQIFNSPSSETESTDGIRFLIPTSRFG
jgi:hypothetical protein